jgi:hypothetical protein
MRQRVCILALLLIAPLQAATLTATVEVPDPIVAEVLVTVNAWRLTQVKEDGTLLYPTLAALGDSILRKAILQIIATQCGQDPNSCPTSIRTKMDARRAAAIDANTEINNAVALP